MSDYAIASVKAVGDDSEGPGEFEAVLSTSTLDRDGEVIADKAFDPLPASIPIYFEHDWKSGASPVGRGIPFYDGAVVKLKGTFASTARAQEIRSLVVEGIVDSMSVGFLNGKRESKSGTRTVTSGEVFEGSLTAIPINTGARVLVAKALGPGPEVRGNIVAKAIEGSVEALQQRVRDALEDAYGEYSAWLRGVLPDAVIFDRGSDTFRQSYTDDGAVVTLTGVAAEVDIHEVVVPDADAPTEAASTLSISPADLAAANAPADDAAEKAKARYRLMSRI